MVQKVNVVQMVDGVEVVEVSGWFHGDTRFTFSITLYAPKVDAQEYFKAETVRWFR